MLLIRIATTLVAQSCKANRCGAVSSTRAAILVRVRLAVRDIRATRKRNYTNYYYCSAYYPHLNLQVRARDPISAPRAVCCGFAVVAYVVLFV